MKSLIFLSSVCISLFHFAPSAHAAPSLDQIYPGYSASVLESPAEVTKLFSEMPTVFRSAGFLSSGSQCYQRAEVWAYDLYKNKHINAMKVFIFYTAAYHEAYLNQEGHSFDWWFHVAPYVVNKDDKGALTESVLDPSFSDTPLSMLDWSQLFVKTHKTCKEFTRYQDFSDELSKTKAGGEHCYLVRVPATDYDPTTVEARDAGKVTSAEWDLDEVDFAINHAVSRGERKSIHKRLGL